MEVSAILKKSIEDYINGDAAAFTTIYNESNRYIYVCINNVVSGNDNKEDMICDIMQDTYVEISKHINSLQNVNQFLSWAGTIATRKCYEYIKKAGRYALLNEDESFDSLADDDNIIPEEIMQNKEKQRLLREIIQNELTEMQKLCVVGYFYNEMKQSEIAKELNIPENSVKSHLLRAKAKIKASVEDLEKNKGTKLYSVAPLLLLLFTDEVKACTVSPAIGQSVLAGVGVSTGQAAVSGAAGASVAGAGTVSASVAGTSSASVASSVGATVGLKAIIIAAAAVVTIGGVAAGIGIAKHMQSENEEPTEVVAETTEEDEETAEEVTKEVTTEEVTTEDVNTESSTWNGIELAECGVEYGITLYERFVHEDTGFGDVAAYTVNTVVESIYVTSEKIVINVADSKALDSNKEVDFDESTTYIRCELIDKNTGDFYVELVQSYSERTFVFNRLKNPLLNNIELDNYLIMISYDKGIYADIIIDDKYPGLIFEIPNEEPDDGLKSTLVDAAKKALEDYGYTDAIAFADYNGDGVPEFFALTGSAFGNLEGSMYKYENNEYVYCMNVNSFGDDATRLYKDTTDGSYVVLEIDYSFTTNDDVEYFSDNTIYMVDVDTKESAIIKTIQGDDIMSVGKRTFYAEDGTSMTAEEFFAMLDSEMSPQYEFVGNISYGYEYYNDDNTELIAAYNYYLDNRLN